MNVVRIFTGPDQQSHFEDIQLSFEGKDKLQSTTPHPASMAVFRRVAVGHVIDWHPAPRRQFVVTLSGQWEIECGDGTVRLFRPGDVMLAEDLTGQGHIARVVGDELHIIMTVPLTG